MSILVDFEIRREIAEGMLVVDPFDDALVQPNSYDVRLANRFSWHEAPQSGAQSGEAGRSDKVGGACGSEEIDDEREGIIDPYISESVQRGVVETVAEDIIIKPGQFILGATFERICLPRYIVGQLTGKSSLARLGVMVHVTAGFIDAGFSHPPAQITLEIVNVGNRPVRLHAGMPIAQMVFTRTAACQVAYNEKATAKYNGQMAAAHSLYYLNKPTASRS